MVQPRVVHERAHPAGIPAVTHPEWHERFAWLEQGITGSGADAGFDLGLFEPDGTPRPTAAAATRRWNALADALGFAAIVHARQPHGVEVRVHGELSGSAGLASAPECDGHVTDTPGMLLAVTVADCVPVTLVDPERRAVAMVHAGWRSAAGGILEVALSRMATQLGAGASRLEAHLGPAICGACYEVGPEVHAAFGGAVPSAPAPIDLRALLARRLTGAGVPDANITVSAWCTRCSAGFFSHRGGDMGRQAAFVGVRS